MYVRVCGSVYAVGFVVFVCCAAEVNPQGKKQEEATKRNLTRKKKDSNFLQHQKCSEEKKKERTYKSVLHKMEKPLHFEIYTRKKKHNDKQREKKKATVELAKK